MKKNKVFFSCILLAAILLVNTVFCFGAEALNGIKTIDELNGKEVGVQTAVCYEDAIKDRIPKANWNYYQMPNDMLLSLQAKKISAFLIEEVGFVAQRYEHPELVRLDEPAGNIDFVVAVGNRDNKQALLNNQMNTFIEKYKADGTADAMYKYWITEWNPDTCVLQFDKIGSGENGTLQIAVEGAYEPFSFTSNGKISGFDIEFIYRFCYEYGYIPEFHQVPFDSIATGIELNIYDFGMNIVYTDERSGSAVLSDVYYSCDTVFVLEGPNPNAMGFFQKIGDQFYKTFIKENRWLMFVEGTGVTVLITLCSILFGTILGFLIYLGCRGGNKIANKAMDFFSWLIQGMPTVLLLMILCYIVFANAGISGIGVSIVGFSFIFACSMFDMLHVGLGAIGKGQTEAARALGYNETKSFFKILLPQAAQHFLPIYKNEVVTLIKETSVVGYIAVLDLTKISELVKSRTYAAFFALIAAAIIYFIIETVMIAIVKRVQVKIDPHRRSPEAILKGIVEQE